LDIDHSSFREAVDIHAIEQFKQDPRINELMRTGDTIGCFYVESPAMRMLLKKLGVQDYLTLVAASSIIRPGVSQSGMMREYILRHRDPERRKQAHPAMYAIMPDTYGVMVYQEDVIKVAHLYAGLTLAEADILRRGMSGKYRSREEFQRVKERFFSNCISKGYPAEESAEIWRQIESFAGYSFAKGHSASYAVESYQSLYLKAYHPLEFMVAVANNFGGFYHTEFYLHEAKRAGAVVEAPCVNRSGELCTLHAAGPWPLAAGGIEDRPAASGQQPKASIYLGLQNIKSLNTDTAERILKDRHRHGPFTGLPDLLHRIPIPVDQARMLIRVGALRFTGKSKPELLWDLTLLHPGAKAIERGTDLFITKPPETRLPELQHFDLSDAYDELELLGFPLCDPFLLVENAGENGKNSEKGENAGKLPDPRTFSPLSPPSPFSPPRISARDMPQHIGKRVTLLGYVVHVKPTRTGTGERMSFGSFIDPAGDFWDSTHFPEVEARYPFRGRGVYRLVGKVEEEFGHCSLSVQHLEKLLWRQDPRYGEK
jgi:DNA polymerase-3 subunit alpha